MKLTRETLKSLIKEELDNLKEFEADTASAADLTKHRLGTARGAQGGITNAERGLIMKLDDLITRAAAAGNITSGPAMTSIKQLALRLSKIAGPSDDEAQVSELSATDIE
jgi:hypothetical protein